MKAAKMKQKASFGPTEWQSFPALSRYFNIGSVLNSTLIAPITITAEVGVAGGYPCPPKGVVNALITFRKYFTIFFFTFNFRSSNNFEQFVFNVYNV